MPEGDFMRIRGVVFGLALVAFTSAANAAAQKSLYERLGGHDAIVAVVDDFVANIGADKRINHFFAKSDPKRVKEKLVEQICAGTGGPCTYTGRDMKTVHHGMGISNKDWDATVQDLVKTLNKFKVPKKEQKELLAVLGPTKKDIVEKM
jgi:hemoglobin